MITGAPLEDARHLTHRYEKLRQEVEAQVIFDFTWVSGNVRIAVELQRIFSY